jgi:catechol 2,3-dioxygenase-like lactoylglutathione lyase family enzyme
MTAGTDGELPRIPGVRYADHVAFTVPDLDQTVRFFVQALGAQELYRSTRGPDARFMPENFAVPTDARLTT